jgi:hypothetical protein
MRGVRTNEPPVRRAGGGLGLERVPRGRRSDPGGAVCLSSSAQTTTTATEWYFATTWLIVTACEACRTTP